MVLIESKPKRPVDVKARQLHLRIAETVEEIRWAQILRYRIFYEEMSASPTKEMAAVGRDFDSFDDYCDHLIVFDTTRSYGPDSVVGTYRLMRRELAAKADGFYSVDEYDISAILNYPGEILELGRSCVAEGYRLGATMQLLWRGIAEYVFNYRIGLMFGCASLPGTDPQELSLPLSYLHYRHLAPPEIRARALKSRYVAMDLVDPEELDVQASRQALPPLIKGYLRLGGYVGDGAVVDEQFGTTDVCVVVKTDWVTEKYYRHYTRADPAKDVAGRYPSRQNNRGADQQDVDT